MATVIFLTITGSNQTWTVPADWNNADNTIECVGAGASGAASRAIYFKTASGGGGGAYSKITNFVAATPGTTTVTYRVGVGGASKHPSLVSDGEDGGDTWFNDTAMPSPGTDNAKCAAKGGMAGAAGNSPKSGGAGGAAASGYGETRNSGGRGGNGSHDATATGGGGAAGPTGDGAAGGDTGGSLTATNGGTADGGTAAGGIGAFSSTTNATGSNGSSNTAWSTYGVGAGGGAATVENNNSTATGGAGAARGGGGAGAISASASVSGFGTSGAGADGLIIITYTPVVTPARRSPFNRAIPKPDSAIADQRARPTREWYLYWAGQGNAQGDIALYAGTGLASTGTVTFANSNGVTFGISDNSLTASVAASTGINVSAGTTSQHLSSLVFSNSNGVGFGLSGSTITASYTQSTHSHSTGPAAISAAGSAISSGTVIFANSNGVSFGANGQTVTATVKTDYAASNNSTQFVQANATFFGTNASGTIASSGISVSVGPYLTTAMASNRGSDFVQATAAFAGTNASGTIASNGVSVSVAAPVTTAGLISAVNVSAGTTSNNLTNLKFADSNGVSFGLDGSTVTASVAGAAQATVSFWPPVVPVTFLQTQNMGSTDTVGGVTSQSGTTLSVFINQIVLDAPVAFSEARWWVQNTSAAGTGSVTHEYRLGFYTNNAGTLSLVKSYLGGIFFSQNSSTAMTQSWWTATTNSTTSQYSTQGNDPNYPTGQRWLNLNDGSSVTLPAGNYYVAYAIHTRASSTPTFVHQGNAQSSNLTSGVPLYGIPPTGNQQRHLLYYGVVSTTFSSRSDVGTFCGLPTAITAAITPVTGVLSNQSTVIRNHFPILVGT